MQFLKRHVWYIVGVGAVVAVVAFLLFRPDKLFVDDVVDESLEQAFATTTAEPVATTTTSPTAATPTTIVDLPGTTAVTSTSTSTSSTTTSTTAAPSGPVEVTAGAFYGIGHSAEGTAAIYEQDGVYVLRFEDDTDIQNGPDLYVWVLADDDYPEDGPGDHIDLGKLKGNVGGQNYELPPEFDPTVHRAVLIWCLRFSTPFAAAPLAT